MSAKKICFVLEYNYIWLHIIANLLFNVKNIILPNSIIYFMGPLKMLEWRVSTLSQFWAVMMKSISNVISSFSSVWVHISDNLPQSVTQIDIYRHTMYPYTIVVSQWNTDVTMHTIAYKWGYFHANRLNPDWIWWVSVCLQTGQGEVHRSSIRQFDLCIDVTMGSWKLEPHDQ